MKSLQHHIDHMHQLLDELIQTATKLKDVSQQVISEEELAPLQQHQQRLLEQLEEADLKLQAHYRGLVEPEIHQSIHDKLYEFQILNQDFIQNLNASHGLIQFELRHLREREGEEKTYIPQLPYPSPLNKMAFSPDRTQAVKSQEPEKSR